MKKVLVFALALACAQGAFAQGTVRFVNNATGFLRANIYGVDPSNPYNSKTGQSASDTPAGSTVYGGPALLGTGYTVQLWGASGVLASDSTLALAASGTSTFRTQTAAAGIFNETAAILNNVPGGASSHATLQLRVWDNKGGTITTWDAANIAWQNGQIAAGKGSLFGVDALGDGGAVAAPLLLNMTSFQLSMVPVPEPSTIALALAGGVGMLFLRRRNK